MAKKILRFAVVLLLLIGIFLRFYKFDAFVTFLGDQGRDAIVLKRILTLEHLPTIGAPTSIGQVYLGPFYYYFIAPWLLIFNFNPIGPALGVAVFSSLFILLNYLVVKELLGKNTALISSLFITFSSVLIESSRFSWNPNLLPLFSLAVVYATIKAQQERKIIYYVLAGAFVSFAIQLHYLALFLAPTVAIIFLWGLLEDRKNVKRHIINILYSFPTFIFFSLPLLVFDLRHNFLNSKNFLKLFQTSTVSQTQNTLGGFFGTFFSLNQYVFQAELNTLFSGLVLVVLLILFVMHIKSNRTFSYIILFFLLSLVGLSLYSGPKYPHYFGSVYALYFLIVSYLLTNLLKSRLSIPVFILFLVAYVYLNSRGYYYFYENGSYQIMRAKTIAQAIKNSVTKQKFTVTALPNQYSDATYRYFLEIWGKRPLEKDTLEPSQELFVICEGLCKPIGNPQWDIAYFKPKKIEETKVIFPSVTMYRLSN